MELAAKYVYEVATERSFSRAAKNLFVSQPALSKTVSRLENELGFRIFNRATVPLSLTPEGKIYLQSLEEIIKSEQVMRMRVRHLSNPNAGTIYLGGSSLVAYNFLPLLTSRIGQTLPQLRVVIDLGYIGNTEYLWEKLEKESMDMIFSYYPHTQPCDATPLFTERLVIVFHRSLPHPAELDRYAFSRSELLSGRLEPEKLFPEDRFSLFREIPLIRVQHGGNYSDLPSFFKDSVPSLYELENTRHVGLHFKLMQAGLGAILASDTVAAVESRESDEENLLFFVPKNPELNTRKMFLIRKKDRIHIPSAEAVYHLALDLCKDGNPFLLPYRKNG